jgi:alpha-beta hydrolase superfamily lysophospholipase
MSRRRLPDAIQPAEIGSHSSRPYWLWLPESGGPWPGMLILHGAGSRKENHGDFGRACAAAGWAALAYDQRGHGESEDEMTPEALDDDATMAAFLGSREGVDPACVCARGSSMGGFMAIHGAAASGGIAGVIAICPAGEAHLLRGLRSSGLEMRAGPGAREELAEWLASSDIGEAVEGLAGRPLLLIHAEGDDRIPVEHSRQLYERAHSPRKLIALPGGHHRSAQHDAELHGLALRWMERKL